MRALFSPVLVSSILLAPVVHGTSLQPGPPGSLPTNHSVVLTFYSTADTRSSYVVDLKGFYEHNFGPATSATSIGAFGSDEARTERFSPTNVSNVAFNSKGGSGSLFAGAGSSFSSSGSGTSIPGSLSGDLGLFGARGFGGDPGLGAGKGLSLSAFLLNPEGGLASGEGPRNVGPSVSATPLPAGWTMMFIGLLAFGVLARLRTLKTSASRPTPTALVVE